MAQPPLIALCRRRPGRVDAERASEGGPGGHSPLDHAGLLGELVRLIFDMNADADAGASA